VLIHDETDRDAIASSLMRYRDERGNDWADIIDLLTVQPQARRLVVRLLGEIDATSDRISLDPPQREAADRNSLASFR
jgi:predicted kinase